MRRRHFPFTVTVSNVLPTLDAGPDQAVVEGQLFTLDPATFSDPGFDNTADPLTWLEQFGSADYDRAEAVTAVGGRGVESIKSAIPFVEQQFLPHAEGTLPAGAQTTVRPVGRDLLLEFWTTDPMQWAP